LTDIVSMSSKGRLLFTDLLWEQGWQGQCLHWPGCSHTAHRPTAHSQPRKRV